MKIEADFYLTCYFSTITFNFSLLYTKSLDEKINIVIHGDEFTPINQKFGRKELNKVKIFLAVFSYSVQGLLSINSYAIFFGVNALKLILKECK